MSLEASFAPFAGSPFATGPMVATGPAVANGPGAELSYCTFQVDRLLLGVEVAHVQEVVRALPMTSVPLAPPEVRGLVNLRGRIATAIDVRRWLGLPPIEDPLAAMNVVVRIGEEAVSLLVDEADDVVVTQAGALDPLPSTASERFHRSIRGIRRLSDRLLLVLDTDAIGGVAAVHDEGSSRRSP